MGLLASQHLPTTLLGDTNIIHPYCGQPISENPIQDAKPCFRNLSYLKKISTRVVKILYLSKKIGFRSKAYGI
jgi:hypothetical protein